LKSLKRVYSHLNNGGYFGFDISTAHKLKDGLGNNTFTQNKEDISYIWDNYIEDNIIEMYITFFVKEGKLYRRFQEHHVQKAWEVDYLIEKLSHVGFKEISVYDDYTMESISSDSSRAVFICKKEE
jgi:hypothetical protein